MSGLWKQGSDLSPVFFNKRNNRVNHFLKFQFVLSVNKQKNPGPCGVCFLGERDNKQGKLVK